MKKLIFALALVLVLTITASEADNQPCVLPCGCLQGAHLSQTVPTSGGLWCKTYSPLVLK